MYNRQVEFAVGKVIEGDGNKARTTLSYTINLIRDICFNRQANA